MGRRAVTRTLSFPLCDPQSAGLSIAAEPTRAMMSTKMGHIYLPSPAHLKERDGLSSADFFSLYHPSPGGLSRYFAGQLKHWTACHPGLMGALGAIPNLPVRLRDARTLHVCRIHVSVQSTCSVTGALPSLVYEIFNRRRSLGGRAWTLDQSLTHLHKN